MKRIVMHIDKLVLKGFRHEDRQGIADGIQHELIRLFADQQAVQQLTACQDVSRLRVGDIHIGQNSKPQQVGLQIAQGIGKGMKI